MKKNSIPLIGMMFCSVCDSFLSMKKTRQEKQIGTKKIYTSSNRLPVERQRYELVYTCRNCGHTKSEIVYL